MSKVKTNEAKRRESESRILYFLARNGPSGFNRIAEATGLSDPTVSARLEAFTGRKTVLHDKTTGLYRLAEKYEKLAEEQYALLWRAGTARAALILSMVNDLDDTAFQIEWVVRYLAYDLARAFRDALSHPENADILVLGCLNAQVQIVHAMYKHLSARADCVPAADRFYKQIREAFEEERDRLFSNYVKSKEPRLRPYAKALVESYERVGHKTLLPPKLWLKEIHKGGNARKEFEKDLGHEADFRVLDDLHMLDV